MPAPVATTLDVLLLAVESKLISASVFASNTCYIGLSPDDLVFPPSDQFCVICPLRQAVDEGIVFGAGNNLLYFEGEFSTTVWNRLALDEVPRSDSWLTDTTYGLFPVVQKVISALQLYQPLDGASNQLIAEPMRLVDVDTFTREVSGVGWGGCTLRWSLNWQFLFAS